MDDLLQSQIRESCKLVLPNGLQELMSDISREVLRAQPEDLYEFIANYLEALLNAREALSIACRICREVSKCSCEAQLEDELFRVGLNHEDASKLKNIILDHFDKGQVQETNLLIKLAAKTSVNEMQLEELQKAIQRAFKKYSLKRKDLQVSFAEFISDSSTGPSTENTVFNVSTQSSASDFYKPTFSIGSISTVQDTQAKQFRSTPTCPPHSSVSASSLAGSYVTLPHNTPYSVHTSECDNMLLKSEKSVLRLLKSFLFGDDGQNREAQIYEQNIDTLYAIDSHELHNTDSEELDDTNPSKISRESERRTIFSAIQENLSESSSGGS